MKRIADHSLPPVASHARWQAKLSLRFEDDAGTTRLVDRSHSGPLRVQKPLYPEGGSICHAIVIHPPGGVVGGDELEIAASVGHDAAAFVTTPGAAKWYKSNGHVSQQDVCLEVGDRASLEWMPQESIFFDASHVRLHHTVDLGRGARYIGCEILCFGRTASGESFETGQLEQRTRIRREGRLIWFEQGTMQAGDAMRSPLGMAGNTVCATLIAVGDPLPAAVINAIRSGDESGCFGVTQMKSVVVVRYLGNSSETAKHLMTHAWQQLRPSLLGRDAMVPRIWNT